MKRVGIGVCMMEEIVPVALLAAQVQGALPAMPFCDIIAEPG
jgi:hypothetical protein